MQAPCFNGIISLLNGEGNKMNKIQLLIDGKNLQDMYTVIYDLNEWDAIDLYKQHIGDAGKLKADELRNALFDYTEKAILELL